MSSPKEKTASKTLREIPKVDVKYIVDDSGQSDRRTREVMDIIFKMMLLAHKKGRPCKNAEEYSDAA